MRARPRPFRIGALLGASAALVACSKREPAPRPQASAAATLSAASAVAAPSGLAAGAPAASGPRPAMTPTGSVSAAARYLVSLDGNDCPVALRINDVPLWVGEAGRAASFGEVVDPWIHAGKNSVTIEARGKLAKGCASLAVLAVPENGDQRNAPRVLDTRWPDADTTSGAQELEFHGPVSERCQLWREAEPIELGAADRAELLERVRALHRQFAGRRVDALAEQTEYRGSDIARCMGKPPASGVADQKRFFSMLTSEADFAAVPLDEAVLTMDVVARGKLVWLRRGDGKLLLENELGQGMDLYAAKIAGRWSIVR